MNLWSTRDGAAVRMTSSELTLFIEGCAQVGKKALSPSAVSLVESAKASGIDPISYLTEVATRAQQSPGAVLLPADFGAQLKTAA
jgi:hypothetical protein